MTETKKVSEMNPDEIKKAVRETYSIVAEGNKTRGTSSSSCCGSQSRKSSSDNLQSV